jgi:hypothetical protein
VEDTRGNADAAAGRGYAPALGLLAVLAIGAALRLWKLPDTSLGYDGLQSVTHAVRAFPVNAISAFLHDPHPPLYYVILGPWMRLGTSDPTVLMLSVLLSLLLVPSVWWIAREHHGPRVALAAALVCALHPLALYWSHFARMYALVMLLSVWTWHWNLRLLEHDALRWRTALALVLTELALVYSHVAAPFFLVFIALHAAWCGRTRRAALRDWAALQAAVAVCALPELYFAFRTGARHMQQPDLAELGRTLSLLVNGVGETSAFWVAAGTAGFALVAAALLARRDTRAFAVCFWVLPFAAAAAVSHLAKPIWYGPRLFAFLVPFVAIGLARLACASDGERAPRAAFATGLLALALLLRGALGYTLHYEKSERFIDAAHILESEARSGDLVLVPTLKQKWALNWYLMGPDWARGAWQAGGIDALRHALDGARRPAFVADLVSYGSQPGPERPPVLAASESGGDSLARASRVWVLTLGASQRDVLLAKFELGPEAHAFQPEGLELSVHARE